MRQMRISGVLTALVAAMLWAAPSAEAQVNIYPLGSGGHYVYIGMARSPGTTSFRAFACFDGPSPGDAQWSLLGGTGGLNNNYLIHGDQQSGGSYTDIMTVIRASTSVGGDCASAGGTNWQALSYNGKFLDLTGDGGGDGVTGGSGDTIVSGGDGNDVVTNWSCATTFARAQGNDGDDIVIGRAGNCDDLFGDAGDDCLDDANNAAATYSCGSGSDRYQSGDSGLAGADCETSVSSCFSPPG